MKDLELKNKIAMYIRENPLVIRPYRIKKACGLMPSDSRYNGILGQMVKEGLLEIQGSYFFGTRRWYVPS